jgi:hypothetical protein
VPGAETTFTGLCQNEELRRTQNILAIAAITFLAGTAFLLYGIVQNIGIAKRQKLVDCTNQKINASFVVPKGKLFNLVLGTTTNLNWSDWSFEGTVEIGTEGNSIQAFPISLEKSTRCNWLERQGIPIAFILTWEFQPNLAFVVGERSEIRIRFSKLPPEGSSLWLTWIQRYGDRAK